MSQNVIKTVYNGKEIYLVKTAHVSKNSIQDVIDTCNAVKPDSICIELDDERYETLTNKEAWRNQDIVKIIKEKKVAFLLVNIILSSFQRRMAKQMDSTSGGEMLEGIRIAKENNLNIVLADRSIKLTFKRIWANLGFVEKLKLIVTIISSIFDDEEISEEELNQLKQSDALEAALNEVGKEFPIVKRILVDERDAYLSKKIREAKGNRVVAIIGAAHANGILNNIANDSEVSFEELEDISSKNKFAGYIKWFIPLAIILMIIYSFINNASVGVSQVKSWVLWNGTLSAIGVACALGHPLSIITAFVMAPVTSLNPLLAAGWFAGLCEAMLRKPKVSDFEDIAKDTSSIKGFWKNKITKILLVVVFANLFSTIGTIVSGLDIFASFMNFFK